MTETILILTLSVALPVLLSILAETVPAIGAYPTNCRPYMGLYQKWKASRQTDSQPTDDRQPTDSQPPLGNDELDNSLTDNTDSSPTDPPVLYQLGRDGQRLVGVNADQEASNKELAHRWQSRFSPKSKV